MNDKWLRLEDRRSLRVLETFSNKAVWKQVPFTEVQPAVSPFRGLGIHEASWYFCVVEEWDFHNSENTGVFFLSVLPFCLVLHNQIIDPIGQPQQNLTGG